MRTLVCKSCGHRVTAFSLKNARFLMSLHVYSHMEEERAEIHIPEKEIIKQIMEVKQ